MAADDYEAAVDLDFRLDASELESLPFYRELNNTKNLDHFLKRLRNEKSLFDGDQQVFTCANQALKGVLIRKRWDNSNEEVNSLVRIYHLFPLLVDCGVLCSLFSNESFDFPFSEQLLTLIHNARAFRIQSKTAQTQDDPCFVNAVAVWIDRMIALYPRFHQGKKKEDLAPVETDYQKFRDKKDQVLSSLAFWKHVYVSQVKRKNEEVAKTYDWMCQSHLKKCCSKSTGPAMNCLHAFGWAAPLFPEPVVEAFQHGLIIASGPFPAMKVFRFLFPPKLSPILDDPARDLGVLSQPDEGNTFAPLIQDFVKIPEGERVSGFEKGTIGSFKPSDRKFIYHQQNLTPWHRDTARRIIYKVVQKQDPFELGGDSSPDETPLCVLFKRTPELWCIFVAWHSEFRKVEPPPVIKPRPGEFMLGHMTKEQMEEWGAMVEQERQIRFTESVLEAFMGFITSVVSRQVKVKTLGDCNITPLLHVALEGLGVLGSRQEIDSLEGEIKKSYGQVQNMKQICRRFIVQDTTTLKILLSVDADWEMLRVIDIDYLFRVVLEVPLTTSPPPGPLPKIFVDSLEWFLHVMNSKLFDFVWKEVGGQEGVEKILTTRKRWQSVFSEVQSKSVTFVRLQTLMKFFGGDEEERILYRSTRPASEGEDVAWDLREVDENELAVIKESLDRFVHLEGVIKNLEAIEDILGYFPNWVKSDRSVARMQSHVKELRNTVKNTEWEDQTLADYQKFARDCEGLHPSFLIVHPSLFEKMLETMDLLDWLRSLPDDRDFTRGIELAMGRSEMECPPELWVEQEGQAGRVNEQILSMLQSVRTYLHPFIYRKEVRFEKAKSMVQEFLAHLAIFEIGILKALDVCNENRLALIELLGSDAATSAPDRLLRMLQPSSKAFWVCDSSTLERGTQGSEVLIGTFLRLDYSIVSRKEETRRNLNVTEVEDFQSAVVLAETDQRGESTRQKIDNFVESFGWIKQFATYLYLLHSLGHFSYDTFHKELSLGVSASEVRNRALNARQTLEEWEEIVHDVRYRYPSLNHFGMKLVWQLAKKLTAQTKKGFSNNASLARKMVYIISPKTAQDRGRMEEIENGLLENWGKLTFESGSKGGNQIEGDVEMVDLRGPVAMEVEEELQEKKMGLKEVLECCGKTFEAVFGKVEKVVRPVGLEEAGSYSLKLKKSDLRLILSPSYELVFQDILSVFVLSSVLPERRTLLLCRQDSSWEDVLLLLLRWRLASSEDEKLFCLGNADLLSNEVQTRCVRFIQEAYLKGDVSVPLLLICGPSKSVFIVSQFINRRIPSSPLPLLFLQSAMDTAEESRILTYSSEHPGSGKTFQIRKGKGFEEKYHHVTVTSIVQFLTQLDGIYRCQSTAEKDLDDLDSSFFDAQPLETLLHLHIDLFDTSGSEVNSFLFELIMFRGYCSFTEGMFFHFPLEAFISVEMPTGPLKKRLTVPRFCPVVDVKPSADLFAVSKRELLKGMGMRQFYGRQYDGTAVWKREKGIRNANAYDRLQYVCSALRILQETGGKFPYVYESRVEEPEALAESMRLSASGNIEVPESHINGAEGYNLLLQASSLPADRTSLWCVWNFVNMVYWQMRDMHFPSSPLNQICMPVEEGQKVNKEESNDAKLVIKGELMAFIIRTACEFATRQSSEKNPDEIRKLEVTGFDRRDFNGAWIKQPYEHHNKPVFRTRTRGSRPMTFYLYYRRGKDQWVIDDVIMADGPTFSSSSSSELSSVWSSIQSWKYNPSIKIIEKRDPNGHRGEAIQMKGHEDDVNNRLLLRQEAYDDIGGKSHYYSPPINEDEETARHVFYRAKDRMWCLSKYCYPEMGAVAIANELKGRWSILPPRKMEKGVNIKVVTEKDLGEGNESSSSGSSSSHQRYDGVVLAEDDEEAEMLAQKDDDFKEFLELEMLFDKTQRWRDSNHECLLFSNVNHIVSFLSMDPDQLRSSMHPSLLKFLVNNKINVGESLDSLSGRFHEVLGALTEVYRSADEANKIGGGNYCLTGDNLLKMLAIFIRLRVGIPVILMGECGCGKTSLLRYLCTWLGVEFIVLDVHGGTTPEDIIGIFRKANERRATIKKPVYVFLDEVNACNHMGLISEAITNRSLNGIPFHDDVYILAALNPYRRRPPQAETFGLVYKQKKGALPVQDNLSSLVYRVTPIPPSLRDFVFDFGSLELKQERLYIQSMVLSQLNLPSLEGLEHSEAERQKAKRQNDYEVITSLVMESQSFVRECEGDPSFVSLRDVRRFIFFTNFLLKTRTYSSEAFATSVIVALALVYYYRLSKEHFRTKFWEKSCDQNCELSQAVADSSFTNPLSVPYSKYFLSLLQKHQEEFCKNMEVEDGIARNAALAENLFVAAVCILTKVPVFLVGKPGTSKTLTLQIIASNLQGKQSPNPFWRNYPAVYVFPYQCSPMSDSRSIQHQFNMAVRYQEHASNTTTVLLLDEVGLAEHSPEMPLKCLHGMLVEPPIAIVGLSNWVLDPAKMNRAVLVQRPEPSEKDISKTGASIMGLPDGLQDSPVSQVLERVSCAYFQVYSHQKGRDFIGMRDYYSLIKSFRQFLPKKSKDLNKLQISKEEIILAICRNFNGRPDIIRDVLQNMCVELYGAAKSGKGEKQPVDWTISKLEKAYGFRVPATSKLIGANLKSVSSRHLMLLTKNCSALSLLFACKEADRNTTKVIIGSEFVEDDTELYLVQQMNEVKLAMATGKLIVLMNADNMYEALYDVLNQRYLTKRDTETGKDQRLLRLAIGSRSSLCPVENGFRIIVIAEQTYAYRELDLPLLNRFEKQIFTPDEVISSNSRATLEKLRNWVDQVVQETKFTSNSSVFPGYHEGTLPSLLYTLEGQFRGKRLAEEKFQKLCKQKAQEKLKMSANPAAIILSPSLKQVEGASYNDLPAAVKGIFGAEDTQACLVVTHSPVSHLEKHLISRLGSDVSVVKLDEVKSEKSFKTLLDDHLKAQSKSGKLLVVQFDPIRCSLLQVSHAKFLCSNAILTAVGSKSRKANKVLFVVHAPPGVRNRSRSFVLDFEEPWECLFLDDLRGLMVSSEKSLALDLAGLLHTPIMKLFELGVLDLEETVASQIPTAVSRIRLPVPNSYSQLGFVNEHTSPWARGEKKSLLDFTDRTLFLRNCMKEEPFRHLFIESVAAILEERSTNTNDGLHLHASLAVGEMACGTLVQSLIYVVGELTMQAMIYVLRQFQKNFNLTTYAVAPKLWLALANNQNVYSAKSLAAVSALGGRKIFQEMAMKEVENGGKAGTFVSTFPFSSAIFAILNGDGTRRAIDAAYESQSHFGLARFEAELHSIAQIYRDMFGKEVDEMGSAHELSYLHDFVALVAPPNSGMTMREIEFVHKAVLNAFHPLALQSPPSIHAAYRQCEGRIQLMCSVLAALPHEHRSKILWGVHEASNLPSFETRMVCLLEAVIGGIIQIVWFRVENLPFVKLNSGEPIPNGLKSGIPLLISSLSPNVTSLLSQLEDEEAQKGEEGALRSLQKQWGAVMVLKLFLEVYEQEDRQWGTGEAGQRIVHLLQSRDCDPHSVEFYNDFWVNVVKFYAQYECCCATGELLTHCDDDASPKAKVSANVTMANDYSPKKSHKSLSGFGLSGFGERFWNEFLGTAKVEKELPVQAQEKKSREKRDDSHQTFFERRLEDCYVRFVDGVLLAPSLSWRHLSRLDRKVTNHVSETLSSPGPSLLMICSAEVSGDEAKRLTIDLSLSSRKILMRSLLRGESELTRKDIGKQQDAEPLFHFTSTLGKKLYLSQVSSKFEQEVEGLQEDVESIQKIQAILTANDVGAAMEWRSGTSDLEIRKQLESLGRLQVVLKWYGRKIGSDQFPSDSLSVHPEYKRFSEFFNGILSVDKADFLRSYVLKTIKSASGMDAILALMFVAGEKNVTWVRFETSCLKLVEEECPIGPLLPLERRRNAEKVVTAVKKLLLNPDQKSALEGVLKCAHLDEALIPTLHQEIVALSIKERKSNEKFLSAILGVADLLAAKVDNKNLARVLPHAVRTILLLCFPTSESDLLPHKAVPCLVVKGQGLTNTAKVFLQIQLRLILGLVAYPDSWIAGLVNEPHKFLNRYLPASKFELPLQQVRWYQCPNGHPYSIGECGRPMQLGNCPDCGVQIGGQHHQNVSGVKEAQSNPLLDMANHLGYQYLPNEFIQEAGRRLESGTVATLRFLVDSCLFLGLQLGTPANSIGRLIGEPNEDQLVGTVKKNMGIRHHELCTVSRIDPVLSGVLLNSFFYGLGSISDHKQFWRDSNSLNKKEAVFEIENLVGRLLAFGFKDIKGGIGDRFSDSWQAAERERVVCRSLGPEAWVALLEREEKVTEPIDLWRFSPSISTDRFKRYAMAKSEELAHKHPLLFAFLKDEHRLQHVQTIIAVLEWHKVLFKAFKNNELDRETAQNITNRDAVNRLETEPEREWGAEVLERYCEAFNASFHLYDRYQCKENPFLTEGGEVDLSGSKMSPGVKMSPEISVLFSLPSFNESHAPGTCTHLLLKRLHTIHEASLGITERNREDARDEEQLAKDGEILRLPEVSCGTPVWLLRQNLVTYDRKSDLLPLLNAYSKFNQGETEYDLRGIENAIRFGVMAGKQSLRLHIRLFQFRGDVRERGGLDSLSSAVPQSKVSESILNLITDEVDTLHRITLLLGACEVIVNFIASVAGQKGTLKELKDMMLRDYAMGTLQMRDWDSISTDSVNEHIRLGHLRSLFTHLEEASGRDAFGAVPESFQEEISQQMKEEIQARLEGNERVFFDIVADQLYNLLTGNLLPEEPQQQEMWRGLPLAFLVAERCQTDEDAELVEDTVPPSLLGSHMVSVCRFLQKN